MLSRSPVPLYFQIASALETRIAGGELPPGTMLPSEKDLARHFGVSLITIRAAMRSLIDKGLIERRPGKGTVVLEKQARAIWELGWLNDLITSVLPSRLDVLEMGNVPAPEWVVARFGLGRDALVHHMLTVRRATQRMNEPFMTTEIYHPVDLGAVLRREDFESDSAQAKLVISIVEKKTGIRIVSVRQTMSVELADKQTSKLLAINAGQSLLVVTRDYFDPVGRLVQTGRSVYRTDHYEYVLSLSRVEHSMTKRGRSSRVSESFSP